jgi:SAM-dependent MidA family methyltransferase
MERLDAFFARANAAYYATRDPYADFTTAPEISQVFGELLGLWAAVVWQSMGAPDPVILAESGPGRGTLMADALRAIGQTVPAFRRALPVHLVETSPRLRAVQAALLPDATWHERIETLPSGPLLLLANEFLDALPIRQQVETATGWAERYVVGGRFVLVPDEPPNASGEVVEFSEAACAVVRHLAARLVREGGAALFLDYGPETSQPGDSLQALRHGAPVDPLADPGSADLTAHVDFPALATVARAAGAAVHGPIPQGLFLTRLGLYPRAQRLARGQPWCRAAELIEAAQRLAEPERMGRLFKAFAVTDPRLPVPPGFAAA